MSAQTELRIGNVFGLSSFFSEQNKIRKITRIKNNKVLIGGKWLNANRLKLVSITEDILLKCGFTPFRWLKDAAVFQGKFFNLTLDGNGVNLFSDTLHNLEPVMHLHKLQNLYYEITGEEMEINFNDTKSENTQMA